MSVSKAVTHVMVVLLSVVLIACNGDDAASTAQPATTAAPLATATTPAQPTTAPTVAPEPTAVPTQPPAPTAEPTTVPTQPPAPTAEPTAAGPYPLTVTDMLGRSVEIPAAPQRIVAISPAPIEMLYIVGGTAVARDSYSSFPAAVADLPQVGRAYAPSTEAIAAQKPDLVLIEGLTQGRLLQPLEQIGAPVVAVTATSLDEVVAGITLIGQVIQQVERAAAVVSGLREQVAAAAVELPEGTTALILISDRDRNLHAAKPESYAGAIAALVGLGNPAADLADSGPVPGYALVSAEQIITMDPTFIFTITPAPPPAPRAVGHAATHSGVQRAGSGEARADP